MGTGSARLREHEQGLVARGIVHVAGVDEAGAGCLAGPVVAAAVVLPERWRHKDVDDSKKLSPARRERLAPIIRDAALAWAVASVEAPEIDRLNILQSRLLAMRKALAALAVQPGHVLVDGDKEIPGLVLPQTAIIGGDGASISIAAASILAKVARDELMTEHDRTHPGYGFAAHKGYPSEEHKRALEALGPCVLHRLTFAPVAALVQKRRG